MSAKPLIAHVLYSLDTGGMERIVVSVINGTSDRYRHAVITLAGFGALRSEIQPGDVACVQLDKKPGKDFGCYVRLWKTLRRLKPDLVQTYNIGTLDFAPVVKFAGVRRLVHAEHGRDIADPRGNNARYQRLRRWMAPFINRYVAVSRDLERWLTGTVGIAPSKVLYVPNGIDTDAFHCKRDRTGPRRALDAFAPPGAVLVGNVARLDKVKDHAGLLRGFQRLRSQVGATGVDCRLVIAGDGPERAELEHLIGALDLADAVRLLGNRTDVADVLADCDVFVLSSVAEGMPLTVLEAMASGLPVVSTDVGSVRDVMVAGTTGALVPPSDPAALANALQSYVVDPALRIRQGRAGRARIEAEFSLAAMLRRYGALYDQLLATGRSATTSRTAVGLAEPGER